MLLSLFCAPWILVIQAIPIYSREESIESLESLSVTMDVPTVVDDVDSFDITVTLRNTGEETIKVVKDPSGVLYDDLPVPVDALAWSGRERKPTFIGATVDWSLKTYLFGAAGISKTKKGGDDLKDLDLSAANPDALITIPVGKSKEVVYQVGLAYDFTQSGTGEYLVKLARDTLWVITDDGKNLKLREVKINVKTHKVRIRKKLSSTRRGFDTRVGGSAESTRARAITMEAKTVQCSDERQIKIQDAAIAADEYVEEANQYLKTSKAPRERYTWWFGDWDHKPSNPGEIAPRDRVIKAFKTMGERPFVSEKYTYNCGCTRWVTAYVIGSFVTNPTINLCRMYWAMFRVVKGNNSYGGTLIHEASHFHDVARTEDHTYIAEEEHTLALESPPDAADNANNYKRFAENVDGRT